MIRNAMAESGAGAGDGTAKSGTCLEGCIWTFSNEGTLTVSPADGVSGIMPDFRMEMPDSVIERAKTLVIRKGVKAPQDASRLFAGLDALSSIDAADLDISGTESMCQMFHGCTSLTDISSLSSWDVSLVRNISFMFDSCTSLADLSPLASWDISHVVRMQGMFLQCTSLTDLSPLASWDISHVVRMNDMFLGCTGLANPESSPWQEWIDSTTSGACGDGCVWELDEEGTLTVSPADGESGTLSWLPGHLADRIVRIVIAKGVKAPQDATELFAGMGLLSSIDAASLDVSGTKNMRSMFSGCTALVDISSLSSWDTSQVEDMNYMFSTCVALADLSSLSSWDTSKLMKMEGMFSGCLFLADLSALSSWNVSQVQNMDYLFWNCSSIKTTASLSVWDTSQAESMRFMFFGCASLADLSGLSSWNVSHTYCMPYMFAYCQSLADISPLSAWDVSQLIDLRFMFQGCTSLANAKPLEAWKVQKDALMYDMFPAGCATPSWLKKDSGTEQ